jgi:hypothetical protein
VLGAKQIDKIICIACQELIGEHSKNGLGRCLFRLQGTYMSEAKERVTTENKEKAKETMSEFKDLNGLEDYNKKGETHLDYLEEDNV